MIYRFASCVIDLDRHLFLRDGVEVHVEPQVFDLISVFAKNADRVLSKDDLITHVWKGLNVSDATISARINALRKAVGDDGKSQKILKTLHGRGFQLIADVTVDEGGRAEPEVAQSQSIQFAQSGDGATIAWAKSGSGPPLVRLGHWLSHLELDWQSPVWRPLLDQLNRERTLIRYDQRGTGLSSRGLGDPQLHDFVSDLLAVADAAGVDHFPIFAASQAVPVAVKFAVAYPERVSALVLYGGYVQGRAVRAQQVGEIDEATLLGLIRAGWGKPDSPFVQAFSSLAVPDANADQRASFIRMQNETIAPDQAAKLRQIIDRFDVSEDLSQIRTPTLVIHANSDGMNPVEQGRALAAGIAGARYVSLDSRNHVPLPQDPAWQIMIRETRDFLQEF